MKGLLIVITMISSLNLLATNLNILSTGAIPDGVTLNTQAIQKAIDKVAKDGGGRVIIPSGRFLSGSLILRSGVSLYLEPNATLLGSTNIDHYQKLKGTLAFLLADQVSDIKIEEKGIIDGQGLDLVLNVDSLFHVGELNINYNFRRMRPYDSRPKLIYFRNCINVEVLGVELKNAADWVQYYDQCENLIIDNIKVNSTAYWNNDGMDITDCQNVRITNSYINSADDGICLKSHSPNHLNDSIYIANCTVRSSASAIKFGTASAGGFKNVKIEDITIYDTFRSAIAIEAVDGGVLENIEINNITATNTGNGIFIRLGHRNQDGEVGALRNVSIRNVRVEIPFIQPDLMYDMRGPELPFFHNPFPNSITGINDHNVENVHLENITITHPGRASRGYAQVPLYRLGGVPENEADYPEFHMFGTIKKISKFFVLTLLFWSNGVLAQQNSLSKAFTQIPIGSFEKVGKGLYIGNVKKMSMMKKASIFKSLKSLLLSTVLLLALGACSGEESKESEKGKPNVVIILTDDMGYGDISCYNPAFVTTPQIDKLADEGVRMTNFYVPAPYCAPSRATLITGRFPLRHQLIRNPTPDAGIDDVGIKAEEVTMGEVFQDAGYQTKLIGKWHLGHKPEFFPIRHGFDEYYGILYSNDMRPVQLIRNDGDTVEYPVDQRTLTMKYTHEALDYIDQQQDSSFFLMLNHAMPHKPLAASDAFYTPDTKDDLYQDVIRELDWSVGKVTAKLAEHNLLDNTIIVFMSDNGPWYGGSSGGLKGMKATTWEGGIRVPFIVRYPEKFQPGVIDVPCWSPDIMPTLFSLVDLEFEPTNQLDGQDITEVLKGNETAHSPIFSMHGDKIITVRKGDYKLFLSKPKTNTKSGDWVDPRRPDGTTIIAQEEQARPEAYPGIVPEVPDKDIQLFNLTDDPTESNDLSESMPEKVDELKKAYQEFIDTI